MLPLHFSPPRIPTSPQPRNQSRPSLVSSLSTSAVHCVSGGWRHTLVIAGPQHEVFAWGWNRFGQLGLDGIQDCSRPCRIRGELEGCSVRSVQAGWRHSIAVTREGEVYVWGRGASGVLGLGGREEDQLMPTRLVALSRGTAELGDLMTQQTVPEADAASKCGLLGFGWGCGGGGTVQVVGRGKALAVCLLGRAWHLLVQREEWLWSWRVAQGTVAAPCGRPLRTGGRNVLLQGRPLPVPGTRGALPSPQTRPPRVSAKPSFILSAGTAWSRSRPARRRAASSPTTTSRRSGRVSEVSIDCGLP